MQELPYAGQRAARAKYLMAAICLTILASNFLGAECNLFSKELELIFVLFLSPLAGKFLVTYYTNYVDVAVLRECSC